MEEKMYIQLLELENDDLVESLINQRQTIGRYKDLSEKLTIDKGRLEDDVNYLAKQRDTISDRVHSYYQGLRKELDLKSRTSPLTDNRLIELNKILADKIKVLTEENQYLTNKNNR